MKNRKIFFILNALFFILLLAGCQEGAVRPDPNIDYTPIAGTWKAEKGAWQITISEGGEVISAIHPLGAVLVKPNETVYTEMKDGSKSSYKGGDFTLYYNPESEQLDVTIKMKNIHVKYLNNEIKGNTETIITGFLSDDYTVWDADIIEMFDYGPRFPQAEPGPVPLKFYKQK